MKHLVVFNIIFDEEVVKTHPEMKEFVIKKLSEIAEIEQIYDTGVIESKTFLPVTLLITKKK